MEHSEEPYHVEIELKNENCKISKFLKEQEIREFKIADIRGMKEGSIRHMLSVPMKFADKVSDNRTIEVSHSNLSGLSAWIVSEGCEVCNSIVSRNAFLISGGSMGREEILYSFIAPSYDVFRTIITELEEKGFEPNVLKLEKFASTGRVLTRKQERRLWHALKAGFFDYPRKITNEELSQALGIMPSTLSENLRRGIRRLLENYFKASD
jgi:predicted DNA binding protein